MGWLRGNLHAHTTYSDGVKTPQELLVEYEVLGYDFLAITDHEDLIGSSYWRALPRLRTRLLLFHGVELNYTGFEQHIGRVLGDREVLHFLNHPARYKLSVAQTIERARTIQRDGLVLDALEVTDTGHHRPLYASPEIPLVKIATDDAHRPVGVVGGDLHQRDLRRRVERPVVAGVGHLQGVENEAVALDRSRALDRLRDRELVARRVVEDVEHLAVAQHAADVLLEPRVVELDPVEEEEAGAEPRQRAPVARADQVLVVRDGEEVVAEHLILDEELLRRLHAVRVRRVRVEVAAQPAHQPGRAIRSARGGLGDAGGRRPVPGHGEADREPAVDLSPATHGAPDWRVRCGPSSDADPAGGGGRHTRGAEAADEARLVGDAAALGIVVRVDRAAFPREARRDHRRRALTPARRRRRLLDLHLLGGGRGRDEQR